jgi:UDPglucose 6-dehydrogenase
VLARLCEQIPGGDVDVVTSALEHDPRVGRGGLRGGIALGGPYFARDLQAFAALMRRLEVAPELLAALGHFDREQVPWLADFVQERLPPGGSVGVLGLSFRPDTDVVVASPALLLCRQLAERGIAVVAHDPAALAAVRSQLPPTVGLRERAEEAIDESDLAVLVTPWRAYLDLPPEAWAREGWPRVVVDCWRALPALAGRPGVTYVPLGTGPVPSAA